LQSAAWALQEQAGSPGLQLPTGVLRRQLRAQGGILLRSWAEATAERAATKRTAVNFILNVWFGFYFFEKKGIVKRSLIVLEKNECC
jgi:hypothetical protein